ncbi:MAG: hypothetical protein IPP48_05335 [Chitinophagaceae bacterium]|nr:hypothetical protein [Chitinophagaceae bacterium]
MSAKVIESSFGIFEGKPVTKYTISSSDGLQVSIINYGATITNILMPDKEGIPGDIVLGFENLEGYINASGVYMGSICGRYANRIANGKFSINNTAYQLSKNDGNNMLHGGFKGFDKVYWNASILPEKDGVVFSYLSKDGEEGFPGNLSVSVTYRLINE